MAVRPALAVSAVQLVEHDPAWTDDFAAVAAALAAPLAGIDARLEHIGSTAVAGLCAKPVIDVLLGVPRLADLESRIAAFGALGWRYRPEHEAELPQRRYFVRPAGAGPRVHLHGVVRGSATWRDQLLFRDALRGDAALRDRYAAIKRSLALRHADDKAAYTAAKAPFVRATLAALRAGAPADDGFRRRIP
jgi:GrpB-like predicted nucleotidyltransferase (UPF0157 family)